MKDKEQQLRKLAIKRQQTRWEGYDCIGDFKGGVYECDFVSPYTKGACNYDAEILIILQDWSSSDMLNGPVDEDSASIGRTPSLPTNRNLSRLLDEYFQISLSDTYATNLFPFIKRGGMSARIKFKHLVEAAKEFTIGQIRIVQPKIAICLGLQTFRAMQVACGQIPSRQLHDAIHTPFMLDNTKVWCQAHTGALGQATRKRGNPVRVDQDWEIMHQHFGQFRDQRA